MARTGWRPEDVAARYPREKTDLDNFHKFDPAVGGAVSAYALVQLVVTMAVGIALLFIPGLSWATNATVVGLMLFTMVCTGHWLDGRVLNLEIARLVLVAAAAWLGWQAGFGLLLAVSVAAYAVLNLLVLPLLANAQLPALALARKWAATELSKIRSISRAAPRPAPGRSWHPYCLSCAWAWRWPGSARSRPGAR